MPLDDVIERATELGGRIAIAAGVLVSLTVAFPSVRVADVLAIFGIVSVAAGFAFEDTFENLLAGVLLMLRDQFQSGDQVTVSVHHRNRGGRHRSSMSSTGTQCSPAGSGQGRLEPSRPMPATPQSLRYRLASSPKVCRRPHRNIG